MAMSYSITWLVAFTFFSLNVMGNSYHMDHAVSSFSVEDMSLQLTPSFERYFELDRSNAATGKVINLKINESLLWTNNLILKTFFRKVEDVSAGNTEMLTTNITLMDVIVHTDTTQSSAWSHGNPEEGRWISKIVYVPHSIEPDGNNETHFSKIKTFLIPTTDQIVKVNVSISLENGNINLNEPEICNLTRDSPLVLRYNHKKTEKQRIRVHTTRIDVDDMESVESGCSVVTIQRIDEPFNYQESDITFKSLWQFMLGRSVIDVNVGVDDDPKKGKNPFEKGFLIVILQKSNKDACRKTKYDISFDGIEDLFSNPLEEKIKSKTMLSRNDIDGEDIRMNISLTVVEYSIEKTSWAIVGISFLIIVGFIAWDKCMGSKYPHIALTGIVRFRGGHARNSLRSVSSVHDWLDISDSENDDEITEVKDDKTTHGDSENADEVTEVTDAKTTHEGKSNINEKVRSKNHQTLFVVDGRMTRKENTQTPAEEENPGEQRLSDLASKCDPYLSYRQLHVRSDMYLWILVIGSVFYIMPALQLMLGAQYVSQNTGSQDLCYYNFLCRHTINLPMFKRINDWNHVFSNIFYVCSGLCFIIAVKIRQKRRYEEMINLYVEDMSNKKIDFEKKKKKFLQKVKKEKLSVEFLNQCGVPEQYGMFYAMGAATIIEGILSSCYHICPTHESFQFDTTFIYIIAILILSKMYQFRHPDLTIKAHTIFSVICFLVFFETLSYYLPVTIYIVLFVLTYLILLGCIFYISGWYTIVVKELMPGCKKGKFEWGKICENYKNMPGMWIEGQKTRSSFIIFQLCLNLALLITSCNVDRDGFASNALMLIFGGNMAGYAFYYQIMKWRYVLRNNARENFKNWILGKIDHPESISRTATIYFWLAMVFLAFGGYFFVSKEKTTELSPSQSRHKNDECILMFFDNHDLWHCTSALGLFFTFMWLLTLEDNNTHTAWKNIPVF